MTIPAMAPLLSPPPPPDVSTGTPVTPVEIGVSKGTVAVGVPVAVTTIRVELVGRNGADGDNVPMMPPEDPPPSCWHVPESDKQ